MGKLFLIFMFLLISATGAANVCVNSQADLSLMLAIDISGSVDEREIETLISGYARAFSDPQVQSNLMNCQCTEISVLLWSSQAELSYSYKRMQSPEDIQDLVGHFRDLANDKSYYQYYRLGYETEVLNAVNTALDFILTRKNFARELHINIAGDGFDSRLFSRLKEFADFRKHVEQEQVNVSALAIEIYRSDSDFVDQPEPGAVPAYTSPYSSIVDFYRREVISRYGYTEQVDSYADVANQMRTILLRETCNLMM